LVVADPPGGFGQADALLRLLVLPGGSGDVSGDDIRGMPVGAGAREYHRYFAGTLLPQLRDLPGFAGGYLLSRDVNGTVELTTHTFWESHAAIRAFAGDDITASVVEPEAQSVLLDFDPTATHRSVLVDARG
jgi:heme-degrading monooxygenase HmoA